MADSASGWKVMDRGWEQVQIKTFTRWCNKYMKRTGEEMTDITKDLTDGLNLIRLVETLGEEKIKQRINRKPTFRVQKVENVGMALQYMAEHGVKVTAIGPEDLVDGNVKLTLGTIWTIIAKWSIEDISIEELNAKEALLLWCQMNTKGYKDVDIRNFTKSWSDGLAFCALVHHFRPNMLNFDDLQADKPEHNMQLAFDCFEELGIPVLLDVEDIAGNPKPEELSVVTQVSELYHFFSGEQQGETAAKRIEKILSMARENAQIRTDYEERTRALLQWMKEAMDYINTRDFNNTYDGIVAKSNEFKQWKRESYPQELTEKLELDGLFNGLQTKLRLTNRPPYAPPEGLSPEAVDSEWKILMDAVLNRGRDIGAEYARQARLEGQYKIFNTRATAIEQWMEVKTAILDAAQVVGTLAEVTAWLNNHARFESEYDSEGEVIQKLGVFVDQMIEDNYHNVAAIQERLQSIHGGFGAVKDLSDARRKALNEALERQKKIEELKTTLASKAQALSVWLTQALATIAEDVFVRSAADREKEESKFAAFCAERDERLPRLAELDAIIEELSGMGVEDFYTYSEVTIDNLKEKIAAVESGVTEYQTRLNAAVEQSDSEQAKVHAFEASVAAFRTELDAENEGVTHLSGSVEEQKTVVEGKIPIINALMDKLQPIKDQYTELEDLNISHLTDYTYDSVDAAYRQLDQYVHKQVELLQAQILEKEGSKVTAEQLATFQHNFQHFDRDKSNGLNALELKSLLTSIGEERDDEFIMNVMNQYNKTLERPEITFDEFVEFITKFLEDTDSPAAIQDAFAVCAEKKAYVTEEDLQKLFSEDDIKYMLSTMPPHPDGVGFDYKAYTEVLFNQ